MALSSVIRYVRALDTSSTTGAGKTGLAFGDITAKYLTKGGTLTSLTTETITTLGTYQAPSSNAHIRIKELNNADPTKGVYEVHFHNDQVAAAGEILWLFLSATGAVFEALELPLYDVPGRLPAALTADGNIKADTLRVNGTSQTAGDLAAMITTVDDLLDTEVAAILAAVDTEVGAIKAKTDNLPSDPADASDITTRFDTLDTSIDALPTNSELLSALATIDDQMLLDLAAVQADVTDILAVTDKLDTTVELDSTVWRFTTNALEQAPSGGGGGDWTADEKTAIRAILGIPASGTTPDDPTTGILDSIRDIVTTISGLLDTEVAAILAAVDTEVAAIKLKTDNLPSDPADASDIASSFSALTTKVDTIRATQVVATGTVAGPSPTTSVFRTSLTATSSIYNDLMIKFTTGVNTGVVKPIYEYQQTNGQITLGPTLDVLPAAPSVGDAFEIVAIHVHTLDDITSETVNAIDNDSTQLAMIISTLSTISGLLDTEIAAILAAVDTEVAAIKLKTDNLPSDPADQSAVEAAISAAWTTVMVESYRATGAVPTRDQLLLELLAGIHNFDITAGVKTVKEVGGDPVKTFQLNDNTNPTAIEELT